MQKERAVDLCEDPLLIHVKLSAEWAVCLRRSASCDKLEQISLSNATLWLTFWSSSTGTRAKKTSLDHWAAVMRCCLLLVVLLMVESSGYLDAEYASVVEIECCDEIWRSQKQS